MEQQFNRRYSARKREFSTGDTVLVKDHYANRWIPGTVRRRLGNVVYQLETKHGMWYEHANQIQQRKSSNELDVKGKLGTFLEDQEQPEYTLIQISDYVDLAGYVKTPTSRRRSKAEDIPLFLIVFTV
ncbi:hypothetical protein TTRE_0000607401 [Trichuris trichiura]|uniref:Uncharacterized protein n=1 Tax=Trichuris trichiura TaxID=36087 RepID=A0A077ZE32_TRITR|nr:hypothetical protein TTRE_0000607401 [Trichuris trichiura]